MLFEIPLEPLLGRRFQPAGFPSLGAAPFQTSDGESLLVESAESMANHPEMTIRDVARKDVEEELDGLSHVRVTRRNEFPTDTILESHRIDSPYLPTSSDRTFLDALLEMLRRELDEDTVDENKGLIDAMGWREPFSNSTAAPWYVDVFFPTTR